MEPPVRGRRGPVTGTVFQATSQPPQPLSKTVVDLLAAGKAREAIQETLLVLASDGNGGSRLDLYLALSKVIPHANEVEYAKLISLLPPFLSATERCLDE